MKRLVVVESPAKARTIKKYLGRGYQVKASVGHVKDLPPKSLGVDVENGFDPTYEVIKGKKKVISEIRKASKEVEAVYLAPDPDREGEAIAWHIANEIKKHNKNIHRVLFNEITKKGVTQGLADPKPLDQKKFESQQARRILDRLVGYQISPLLWKKVKRGLSAGRVQSVAVRLVVEREREIAAFNPDEYWNITCRLLTPRDELFDARLAKISGKKAQVRNEKTAGGLTKELKESDFVVSKVTRTEKKRRPPPPFITSKLQQDAVRKFRFTAKRTMALAQRLYEGVDLGGAEGVEGLITYMRTDSTRIAEDALSEVRSHIAEVFGPEYLPPKPIRYKNRKGAQDAHEAIRPTNVAWDPDTVRRLLTRPVEKKFARASGGASPKLKRQRKEATDLARLYGLIWKRFVACQMKPALYDQTVVEVEAGRLGLRAAGSVLKFKGFTAVYEEARDENGANGADGADGAVDPTAGPTAGPPAGATARGTKSPADGPAAGPGADPAAGPEQIGSTLPRMEEGEPLKLKEILPEQKFTQPPPRFTEATLVKELEERGIGRPSTYAAILSTIQDRQYVNKDKARFHPTDLGTLVNDLLVENFPDILNVEFTARMEDLLDRIEEGNADWVETLKSFYEPFKKRLDKAAEHMRNVKRQAIPTEYKCEKCGAPMVVRWGRNGEFLACSKWPDCRNTMEVRRRSDGTFEAVERQTTDEKCDKCGATLIIRSGRYGEFLSCSTYPDCKFTKAISLGIDCPRDKCGGQIVQKRSRRGKIFFGCSNYASTGCDFVTWDRPTNHKCPQCGFPVAVIKSTRKGTSFMCASCKARTSMPETPAAAAEEKS